VIGPDGDVVEYIVGDKHLMVIPGANAGDGVREVPVPRSLRSVPVLSDVQTKEIGSIARELSAKLGYHADIEGAYAGSVLYLLQARPITTLGSRAMNRSIEKPGGQPEPAKDAISGNWPRQSKE
jgi:pyruvate,water dikinase